MPPSLDDVLAKADQALEASDVQTALGLFTYAADVLQRRLDGTPAAAANGNGSAIASVDENEIRSLLSRVLGQAGEARVSLGDPEGGRENFEEAIELLGNLTTDEEMAGSEVDHASSTADAQTCEARAGLHLYLGQLSAGKEALASYQAGVKDLERCVKILDRIANTGAASAGARAVEDGNGEGSFQTALVETRKQLCGAYCSVVELYMTDLCFEPDAEEQCEAFLSSALAVDDGTAPDAMQTKANLRLSQRRGEEAVHSILEAYSRMRAGCEAMADLVGLGREDEERRKKSNDKDDEEAKAKELVEIDAANSLPGFEFRCQTSKILLECAAVLGDSDRGGGEGADDSDARRNACVECAIQVLGSLLAENDEVVEVWYLLGCAFEVMSPTNVDAAKFYWETALAMLAKVQEGMEQAGDEVDDEELQCVIDQSNEIKERLDNLLDEAEEDE